MRRTHATDVALSLGVLGGQIAGVSSDVTTAMTAAADTWEQVSVTFTPSEAGVVEISALISGVGGANFGWFDGPIEVL